MSGCLIVCVIKYLVINQWRTQNIFIGGFHSVAYGAHLFVICGLCDVTF